MSEILIHRAFMAAPCRLIITAFISLLIWPLAGLTQEENPFLSEEPSYFDWLDKPRDYLSQHFVSLSNRVDQYFADERVFQEAQTSYLRFYGDLVFKKSGWSNFNPKLQAKLVLPALQKRLHLLLESNTDVTGEPQTSSVSTQKGVPNVNVPNDFRAAVQVQVTDTPHYNINTDAGIRIHSLSFPPFARLRISRVQTVKKWQFRLTEALYWYESSGMGESTLYDADYKFSDHYLGRSRTQAIWSDHDQRFDFEQSFFLFNPIDNSHALSYQVSVFGVSQPNSRISDYSVSVTWRVRIHREWLFLDVQPGISWPESEYFHATPALVFRIEAIFGDLACGCYGM